MCLSYCGGGLGPFARCIAHVLVFLSSWLFAARLRREHHAILDAIDSGDAPTARRLVHDHIAGYYADAGLAAS